MSIDLRERLTLVVPTYNRYPFLKRLLRYYRDQGCETTLVVGDSSTQTLPDEVRELLDASGARYHRVDPQTNTQDKVLFLLAQVTSPYVVVCADDDFLVPEALQACVSFLAAHPGYSVAQGGMFNHFLKRGHGGRIAFVQYPISERGESVEDDSAGARLKHHLSVYHRSVHTFYGVHRTVELREIFETAIGVTGHGRLAEVVMTGLSVIYGRMKLLPLVYCSREDQESSVEKVEPKRTYFHLSWEEFFGQRNAPAECAAAIDAFARKMVLKQAISACDARACAVQALQGYLAFVRARIAAEQRTRVLKRTLQRLGVFTGVRSLARTAALTMRVKRSAGAHERCVRLFAATDPCAAAALSRIRQAVTEAGVAVIS